MSLNTLARNSSVAAIAEVAGLTADFATTVLVARFIGAARYGVYTAGYTLATLLAVVATLGLRYGVIRHLGLHRRHQKEQLRVIRAAVGASLAAGVVMMTVLAVAAGPIAHRGFQMPALAPLLPVFAACVPLVAVGNVLVASLLGLNRVIASALTDRAVRPFSLLLLTGVVLLLNLGLPGLAYRDLANGLVVLTWAAVVLSRQGWGDGPDGAEGVRSTARDLFAFSLPLLLAEFLYLIMLRTDVIMLAAFRSDSEVGVFGVVMRLGWVTMIPVIAIDASTFPALAEHFGQSDLDQVRKLYATSVRWALSVVTPVAVVVWVFPREVLSLFGAEFTAGVWPLRIVTAGFWLRAALGSVSGLITMSGRSMVSLAITAGALVFNILANVVLVRQFGTVGAAAATGGITALSGLAMLAVARRMVPVVYSFRPASRTILVSIAAVTAGLFAQRVMGHMWVPLRLLTVALTTAAVFVSCTIALGGWHSDDRALLRDLWRRIVRSTL